MMRGKLGVMRGKTRSALTLVSIAIGVFSVVVIATISAIGTNEIGKTLDQMGINSILVQPTATSFAALSKDDIQTVASIEGVGKAMPLMAQNTEVRLLDKSLKAYAWGINKDAKDIISLEAKHGRLITPGDTAKSAMVCVIDEDIATSIYGRSNIVGKTARLLIGSAYYDFEIVGVARSGISSLQASLSNFIPQFVYIPINTMQMLTGRSSFDKVAVLVDETAGENIAADIEERLATVEGEISAANLLQQKSQLEKIISVVSAVLTVIAGISLVVSGLSVMTTMLVSVNERKREIGIKKAIGARNGDIMTEFLLESMLLTLTGSLLGAAAAILLAFVACAIVGVSFVADVGAVLLAIGISVFMGAMFGVYPASQAAKLPPIEALRS